MKKYNSMCIYIYLNMQDKHVLNYQLIENYTSRYKPESNHVSYI